ncbi:MAG TPA: hypothetical protein VLC79_10845 [Cellvibrio sp.]|nr:hypothetical protein [Cellvibrio sp.]
MKKIGLLCFLLFPILSFAAEPSIQAECKSGYKEFHNDGTKLKLCPNDDGSYKVDATAVGANYHTCWWSLTLSKDKDSFSASGGDCTLNVSFGEGSLNGQFVGKCRDYCGARASFKSGSFIEHITATSKKVAPTNGANSKKSQAIQLWTGNKLLSGDVAACALKVENALNSLGFIDITKSVYPRETYFYANLNENRTGIHCTNIAGQTFVYGSVAGVNVKKVEQLRNQIFGKF